MTLGEALAACGSLGVLLDIKLTQEAQIPTVIDEIVRATAVERTMLGLRGIDLIVAARAVRPDIAILAFLEEPNSALAAREAGANWFRLWQGAATAERAAVVREAGMRLAVMVGQPRSVPLPEYPPFPVGAIDRDGLERLRSVAPDAILLDDPRIAFACFE
jgi:glycerophosphoryl diester phosphodiesterase